MPVAYGHHHNGGIVADCLVFHQRFRKLRPMLHNRVDVQQVTACGHGRHGGHPWRSRATRARACSVGRTPSTVSVPYDWFQRSIPQAWKPMAKRAMLAGTPHRPSETPANDARLTTFASTWPTPYVDTGYPGSGPSPSRNSASRIAATPSWR